jgi:branched-subunit amino acid transport protein
MTIREAILIAGMALVTFGVRYPVLALVSRVALPPALENAMRFIPPAVLGAIIAPALLMPNGQAIDLHYRNSYLIAGLVTALVAWRGKNLLLTIVVGMVILWLWRWLLMSIGLN